MKLLWSPKSPFVRKVMILARELGLMSRLELERQVAVPRGVPNPAIMALNPLGKIPAMKLADGRVIIGSDDICDYLCSLVPEGRLLLPVEGVGRLEQLRWQTLGDQFLDLLLDWRIEAMAPGGVEPARQDSFVAKARAVMALFEEEAGALSIAPFGPGPIAVVCALGQLEFRFPESHWQAHFPALAQLAAELSARASVAATAIVNDTGETGPDLNLRFE